MKTSKSRTTTRTSNIADIRIGEFEELVLLATLKLGPDQAYGVAILDALKNVGRNTGIGALYTTLSRLEDKGLISSYMGDPTVERGGRAKKYFTVNASGLRALSEAHNARAKLSPKLGFTFGGVK